MTYVKPRNERRLATARYRANTYMIGGSSAIQSRPLLYLYNPAASGKTLHVSYVAFDIMVTSGGYQTSVPIGSIANVLKVWRFSGIPSGGSTANPVKKDGTLANSVATCLQVISSEGGSGSLVTNTTLGGVLGECFESRAFGSSTTVTSSYEQFDRIELFELDDIVLVGGEGLAVGYQCYIAALDPSNNTRIVTIDWWEE